MWWWWGGHCVCVGGGLTAYINQVSKVTGWDMATENLSFVSLGHFPVTNAEMACNQGRQETSRDETSLCVYCFKYLNIALNLC